MTFTSCGQVNERTSGQGKNPCLNGGETYYFGVEINGTLCGYSISKECNGIIDGEEMAFESHDVIMKLSIMGEGMDVRLYSLFNTDPGSGRVKYCEMHIRNGNSDVVSTSRIAGDTVWFTGNNSQEPRKILLPPDIILETLLKSPHLLRDFVQKGLSEKKYQVYEPLKGEVIEKSYLKKGDETITLKDTLFGTIILEETDLSTGTKSTIWLNKNDGMAVKTLVSSRNIYLTDESVVDRISKANLDNVIFARVNRIIPDFLKVTSMKVKARIESVGEIISQEGLNYPGQKFTGTVKDNFIDGIFELEPKDMMEPMPRLSLLISAQILN